MQETRTHGFTLSAREVRAALQTAYPDNIRIRTMPENFTLSADGSGIMVSYVVRVAPSAVTAVKPYPAHGAA